MDYIKSMMREQFVNYGNGMSGLLPVKSLYLIKITRQIKLFITNFKLLKHQVLGLKLLYFQKQNQFLPSILHNIRVLDHIKDSYPFFF